VADLTSAGGRLAGEMALITGSTSGLGKAIAVRFAAEGAAVCVTGRDPTRGAEVLERVTAAGGRAVFVAADLASAEECRMLVQAAVEALGGLTVVVNNAVASSVSGDGPVTDVDPEAWERVLRVNLGGPAFLCRAAIPEMRRAGHGSIVNISSRAAERGTPGLAAYSASKGGLNALTRSIAVDYAADGIRCNTVQPGYVLHERRDAALDETRRRRLEGMVLGELGTADDVALAVVYLASRESGHVTGITLPVDGGSTAARGLVLG
jgi:NAD(P)-dependent dehydrogenase (short-subunit alcohol dehydrogenase family)